MINNSILSYLHIELLSLSESYFSEHRLGQFNMSKFR